MGRRCVPWRGSPDELLPPHTHSGQGVEGAVAAGDMAASCDLCKESMGALGFPTFWKESEAVRLEAQGSLGGSCGGWVTLPPFLSILFHLQSPVTSQRQSLFPH